jgi:hypothetical protein
MPHIAIAAADSAAACCCCCCLPGEGDLKQLLQGKGVSLSSQFRLTYSMMLNLLRVEDLKVRKLGCKPVNL